MIILKKKKIFKFKLIKIIYLKEQKNLLFKISM